MKDEGSALSKFAERTVSQPKSCCPRSGENGVQRHALAVAPFVAERALDFVEKASLPYISIVA